ncbi:MAG: DUF3344 domain-containing protein [Chloroflexota bacterium]
MKYLYSLARQTARIHRPRRKSIFMMGSFLLLAFLVAASAHLAPAQADGDNVLAESIHLVVRGDVIASGVGLRRAGTGVLTVTEIPAGASVHRAYLYWATLGSSDEFTEVTLNGADVDGDVIGTAGDTCWNADHNYVYRADVTGLVEENGAYTIDGLPNLLREGNDSQGASLVIVYHDPTDRYREIVINDGAVVLDLDVHSYTDVIGDFTNDTPVTDAHVTYLVGDGQTAWDDGDVLFNGTSIASNVFNGSDGDYWGTLTFDVTALVQNPSVTTQISNLAPVGSTPDCLLWAATIFSITRPVPVYDEFIFVPIVIR